MVSLCVAASCTSFRLFGVALALDRSRRGAEAELEARYERYEKDDELTVDVFPILSILIC